jgi:hypothetical protein
MKSSSFGFIRHHSQQKQQRDTSGPHAGYGDRHRSGDRYFSVEAHRSSSIQLNNAMSTSLGANDLPTRRN